jgi:amino acid adenylation domain-containing protein
MATLSDYLDEAYAVAPGKVAVKFGDATLTYAELHRRSRSLAGALRRAGVRCGDRVAIWLNKSPEAVVAIHAALGLGAAYVPLDPTAPVNRVRTILADCRPTALVSDRARVELLDKELFSDLDPVTLVLTDDDDAAVDQPCLAFTEAIAGPAGAEPAADDRPGDTDLAYILYTSGSTGVPKGVMLSHRNARCYVDWCRATFGLTSDDRLSSHAPFHFDLSILDLFAAASAAATLVLVPEYIAGIGAGMVRLIDRERISVWYSVPAALIRMLDARNAGLLTRGSLRTVLFAGEVFPLKHLRRLRAAVPGSELYNLYGPTETNVCTYHHVIDADLAPEVDQPVPIGVVCPYDTAVLLTDDGHARALAPGAEGELCIGGDSVMLGYWNDPAKTAGRIFRPDCGRPMYRTGDLVRCAEDGALRFLGRRDHMVKIRGYRVELGDVEVKLQGFAGVSEGVCVALPDADGGTRLEAYVAPLPDARLTAAGLREHCLAELPRYMVPERFHIVADLPRTSTGKIDRRALAQAGG